MGDGGGGCDGGGGDVCLIVFFNGWGLRNQENLNMMLSGSLLGQIVKKNRS